MNKDKSEHPKTGTDALDAMEAGEGSTTKGITPKGSETPDDSTFVESPAKAESNQEANSSSGMESRIDECKASKKGDTNCCHVGLNEVSPVAPHPALTNEKRISDFDVLQVVQLRDSGNPDRMEREQAKLAEYSSRMENGLTTHQDKGGHVGQSQPEKRCERQPVKRYPKEEQVAFTCDPSDEFNVLDVVRQRQANKGQCYMEQSQTEKSLEEQPMKRCPKQEIVNFTVHPSGEFGVLDVVRQRHAIDCQSFCRTMVGDPETQPTESQTLPVDVCQPPPQPGAYCGAPGEELQRMAKVRFSLFNTPDNSVGSLTSLASLASVASEGRSCSDAQVASSLDESSKSQILDESNISQSDDRDRTIWMSAGFRSPIRHSLAQALPVEEEDDPQIQAVPFDVEASKMRKSAQKRSVRIVFICMLLIGTVVVINLGLALRSQNETFGSPPTPEWSTAPSEGPSSSPTTSLNLFLEGLPSDTVNKIYISGTPQEQAYAWVSNHQNFTQLPQWKVRQLFALATFYFAFEGPSWFGAARIDWLDEGKDECTWFSESFGSFCGEGYEETEMPYTPIEPCNKNGVFQALQLGCLQLDNFSPAIPPEISLLTSLSTIWLQQSGINASLAKLLPSELFHMTSMQTLVFSDNSLTGTIPSELGLLLDMKELHLFQNKMTGTLPSELGLFSKMTTLYTGYNDLTGKIPSELGRLTDLQRVMLASNRLTGQVPSDLGAWTSLTNLDLTSNRLTGSIPSELGFMTKLEIWTVRDNRMTGTIPKELFYLTNIVGLDLGSNMFSGPIPTHLPLLTNLLFLGLGNNIISGPLPTELGLLSNMKYLTLHGNDINGTIPIEVGWLVQEGFLRTLSLDNNTLSGVVSDELCLLNKWNPDSFIGLSFDCNDQLCGCCWCPCQTNETNPNIMDCRVAGHFSPELDDSEWPGRFPAPFNGSNTITINFRSDNVPQETSWELMVRSDSGYWDVLNSKTLGNASGLLSYTFNVDADSHYRLRVFDSGGDGTCCSLGSNGWFTITNSVPSVDYTLGTVVWNATGDVFQDQLDVYFLVDSKGNAHLLGMDVNVPFDPSVEDQEWPGAFPTPVNISNMVTVNIRTDDLPLQTVLEWSKQIQNELWELLDVSSPTSKSTVLSYGKSVESDTKYRLRVVDNGMDGICCFNDYGWLSITNATASADFANGTVLWSAPGDVFYSQLEVFLWVDFAGNAIYIGTTE